ncbi:hypothetical protein [Halomontanus rarus]|uniref:hypothetical protein n=1 Tax=Halomontanus rarus TaxID=3034020 RepID=UPI00307B5FE1
MHSRYTTLFVAVLLVASLVVPAAIGTGAATADPGNTTALDEDTALTKNATITDYKTDGVASAGVSVPDMTITVADSAEDVGLHGIRYTDFDTTYLRVEYEESIDRTIRFYVPRDYWHPHPDELEAVEGDTTASIEPTEGSNYTAVTVHFEEETDAVFRVKEQASIVFSARDYGSEWLENETGIDMPQLNGASEQWEYVPTSDLTEDGPTFGIDTEGEDLTLQYDAAKTADPTGKEWRTVPECSSSSGKDAPVCTFEQTDRPDRVNILAQEGEPPDVRFKYGTDWFANLRSSFSELFGDIPSEFSSDVRGFIDGVLS